MHEALALSGLLAIVLHGLLLLPDTYLHPGLAGIAIPFVASHQPFWTALGVTAGWMSAVITLSFYVRSWIGVRAWRRLHRWTLAVWALGIAHTLGLGNRRGRRLAPGDARDHHRARPRRGRPPDPHARPRTADRDPMT